MRDAGTPYNVVLSIHRDGKGIPYGGHPEPYAEGAQNFGFKNLKGNPERLANIPELADDPALKALLKAINDNICGLVSVGCANWQHSEEHEEEVGHRMDGYVEFAINSAQAIQDASVYFPIFFHFDRFLRETGFEEVVNYNWALAGSHFWPANVDGFTCTVWIYTPWLRSADEAKGAWTRALAPLTAYLGAFPIRDGDPLFTADTDTELR